MKKRLLSILLAVCMLMILLPTAALAGVPTPPIKVGTTAVENGTDTTYWKAGETAGTLQAGTDTDWTVKYEPGTPTSTLTLKNADITGGIIGEEGECGIYAANDLNIVLEGDSVVRSGAVDNEDTYGVRALRGLTISGSGSLAVCGEDTEGDSYGICADGALTINLTGTLTAVGGKGDISVGLCAMNDNSISVINGAVTAVGGESILWSCGAYSEGGNITVSGGKLVAVGGKAPPNMSTGVYALPGSSEGTISYSGGLLVAKGGDMAINEAVDFGSLQSEDYAVTYPLSGKYYVVSPVTAGLADYHVVLGEVNLDNPLDQPNHITWSGNNLTLKDTVIIDDTETSLSVGLTILGSNTLTLEGFNVVLGSDGSVANLCVYAGLITGGDTDTLVAIAGTATDTTEGKSLGVFLNGSLTGGRLIAVGGSAPVNSFGMVVPSTIIVTGGSGVAVAGSASVASSATVADALNGTPPLQSLIAGAWDGKVAVWKAATPVSTTAIAGVTAPVAGGTPVTTITECDQYTGTVTWGDNPTTFANSTAYTATITLTPKAGYTLTGVTENFFTVAGANEVTNSANSGVITAVFPKTGRAPHSEHRGWGPVTAIGFNYGTSDSTDGFIDITMPETDGYYTYGTATGGTASETASDALTLPASGWNWAVQYHETSVNGAHCTLTLNNFDISGDTEYDGMMFTIPLNLVLNGTNIINTPDGGSALNGDNSWGYIPQNIVQNGMKIINTSVTPVGGSALSGDTNTYTLGNNTVLGFPRGVNLHISGNGSLTATGRDIGISCTGILTIAGGTIQASSTNNCGIQGLRGVTISGGTVTASSSGAVGINTRTEDSYGGTISISGGTVTAQGGSKAVGIAPTLTNVVALGSENYNGSGAVSYNQENSDDYKWFYAGAPLPAHDIHYHSFGRNWAHNATHHFHECWCGVINDSAEHTAGDWIVDVKATYTTEGSRHKECTVCGYVMATEIIPVLTRLPFTDVGENDWYEGAVRYVYENGLMDGVGGGAFAPDGITTRSQVVTVFWRLEHEPMTGVSDFYDVLSGQWYFDAVAWGAGTDIVLGYGDGSFGPNDNITREQLAAMLYRYAQYKGYDVSVGEDTNILSYADALEASECAYPALQWACGAGILQGSGDMLMPRGSAQRCQIAAMLQRFCELYAR